MAEVVEKEAVMEANVEMEEPDKLEVKAKKNRLKEDRFVKECRYS